MDTPTLVSLPLPMATALLCAVLGGLVWRLELGARRANIVFASFFGLGTVTSFLVALRFGYGQDALIPLQRTLPLFLAPLLYLGFASLTVEGRRFARLALLHLGAPIVVMVGFLALASDLRALDLVISASYAFYSVVLFLLWRRGPDAFIHAPVTATGPLSNWVLRGIGFLVFILLLDSAIAIDFMLTQGMHASTLISYGTVPLVLVLLATVITLPMVFSRSRTVADVPPVAVTEEDGLLQDLERLMTEQKIYLEPDITVQRLARRLSVPARNISAAVNSSHGMNMSQYVNKFRLAHAARLLSDTDDSVTSICTQSGFLTRSNFYREFQRVYGQTPIAYRDTSKAR